MLSENIARLQEECGETNYRLAKELGVHQTTIQNWKNGIKPHPIYLKLLAEHYGTTVENLLSDNPE